MIDNLAASSSGKTPVVAQLVGQLQQRGIRMGVVSWGYGGEARSYPLLLSADATTIQAGDRPVLIYQHTGVPVAVSPVRSGAIKTILVQHSDVQIIATNDGLQHCRLARDVEIVVIDDVCRLGNGWQLPVGSVRERAERLRSANAVVVNGGVPRSGEIPMYLLPGQAVNLRADTRCDVARLKHVVAIAGTEHPPCSFATLKMYGVQPEKCVPLVDYQSLNYADVGALVNTGQTLVMIEKDTIKCRAFAKENWWYLPVDAQLSGNEPAKLLAQLTSLISDHQLRRNNVRLMES